MRYGFLAVSAVILWVGQALAATPGQVSVKWNDLRPWVAGSKVAMILPSGTHIEGKIHAVEQDGLRMHVSKTSDKSVIRKGDRFIPRQSVSLLSVTKYGVKWRVLCTLGAAATAGIVVAAQDVSVNEGPLVAIVPAVEAGGLIGTGVAGYYIGKKIDKHVTMIRVVSEK
jgi:hypothetical protein